MQMLQWVMSFVKQGYKVKHLFVRYARIVKSYLIGFSKGY